MEWQSQQEYLRGGGRGGGHPTSSIRPEGFGYCLSKDRFLQCQDGILLLNLKYGRLTELKSFLSIFRDQCKKKKKKCINPSGDFSKSTAWHANMRIKCLICQHGCFQDVTEGV